MTKGIAKKNTLWYRQPAARWIDALPVGNGKLAGMVCGRIYTERIHLNEDSVWSGGPQDRNNRDAFSHLEEIRRLIFEGRIKEAERLGSLTLTGTPDGQRHYQPLGDLFIFMSGSRGEVTDYRRELDLEDGVARVSYKLGDALYRREVFCSFPDRVMAVRLTSDRPAGLSFMVQLSRGALQLPWMGRDPEINSDIPLDESRMWHPISYQGFSEGLEVAAPDMLVLKGAAGGENGIRFRAALKAVVQGGSVHTLGDHLVVENADSATLILGASTSFYGGDPDQACRDAVVRASGKTYAELLARHREDHKKLYGRVALEIDCPQSGPDLELLPTDERVENIRKGGADPGMARICFQYGRYLLIAGSRPGSLPANLQGKWSADLMPMWDSKYTININIQMNYWPAEKCNLSECHEPLFDLLNRMRGPGRVTAQKMYGCRGFVCHHNTDIWADTAPQDIYMPATFWPMGAVWFCLHLWEHYEFTLDTGFLKKAYAIMKEASEFFLDFLIEDENGALVTCPSISPENRYLLPDGTPVSVGIGTAMDMEMLHELFGCVLKSIDILGSDYEFGRTLKAAMDKLLKPKIGSFGQIQEWYGDYPEQFVGHYHLSPIFSLFPGSWFTPEMDSGYTGAARSTLERRTDNWKRYSAFPGVWAANLWARLKEGDRACACLNGYMASSLSPNLFNSLSDLEYAFQIDGNFGFTSGVAEMLLQSHAGKIDLLPALPEEWPSGRITGLRARGGFEVDIQWERGRLKTATVLSLSGGNCRIRTKEKCTVTCGGKAIDLKGEAEGVFAFETGKGGKYIVEGV